MEAFVRDLFESCTGSTEGQFGIPQLRQVLRSLGSPELPEADLQDMMVRLDCDGDGVVSLDDFTTAMVDYIGASAGHGGVVVPDAQNGVCGDGVKGQDRNQQQHQHQHRDGQHHHSDEHDDEHDEHQNPLDGSGLPMSPGKGRPFEFSPELEGRPRLGSLDAEVRLHRLLDQFALRAGLAVQQRDELLSAVQLFVDSRASHSDGSGGDGGKDGDTGLEEQVERRCQKLRAENAALEKEFLRLERELQERDLLRKRLSETSLELQRAQEEVDLAQVEVRRCHESEKIAQGMLDELRSECARLSGRVDLLEGELSFQLEHEQHLMDERQRAVDEMEALREERQALLHDFSTVNQERDDDRLRAADQSDMMDTLALEKDVLVARIRELEACLATREDMLEEAQASLDEQAAVLQSLRADADAGDVHGSIMNEIEDLVKFQLAGSMEPTEASRMTVSLLQKLLPKIEETALSARDDASSAPTSNASSPRRVNRIVVAPKIDDDEDEDDDDDDDDDENEGDVEIEGVEKLNFSGSEATDDSGVQPDLVQQVTEGKLEDALRLYVASTQMLAGAKLVTPDQAAEMDVPALRKLAGTMKDLVAARSQRLIEALKERDRLRSELDFKNMVALPLINIAKQTGTTTVMTPTGLQLQPSTPRTPSHLNGSGSPGSAEKGTAAKSTKRNSSARKRPLLSRLRLFSSDSPSRRGPEGTEVAV